VGVGRWQPNAQGRLAQAALELYAERGYEQTTVAEIAARAGLTERTFFRYFADKREVLFAGSRELEDAMVDAVVGAPESAGPLAAVSAALEAAGALLQQRRAFAGKRAAVIAANPELQERELRKMASLGEALARALRARGVEDPAARLTAEIAIAVFRISFDRWLAAGNQGSLPELMRESLEELQSLARTGGAGYAKPAGVISSSSSSSNSREVRS
jgi:AcrR family transcriptional regulator